MAAKYVPPQQSVAGQFIDIIVLAALVGVALFLPLWLKIAVPSRVESLPAGVTYVAAEDGAKTWTGLSWEVLGQNETMQAQWEKLGYTVESAADMITMPFDYTIDVAGLIVTLVVIIGYYIFVLMYSAKEYREVIAEKFEGRS